MDNVCTDQTTDFEYDVLDASQIRILQLDPGEEGDALTGELIITQLDNHTIEYDALSYMWGDPAPTDVLQTSSQALPIASNLKSALTHLRYKDKPLNIWVDAICIDQRNYTERAEQVQLMRRLYKSANMVRVWIDEPGIDETSEAMAALQNFPQNEIDPDGDHMGTVMQDLGDKPDFWDPVLPLFRNKYWSRAWIQQEVLNASQLNLHCGNISIPGRSLARFKQSFNWLFGFVMSSSDTYVRAWLEPCRAIICTRPVNDIGLNSAHRQTNSNLHDLLTMTTVACSKPQDHIYAIMHIARDYEEGGIQVNYSKTNYEVAVDAAYYHVQKHRDVRFLSNAYLRKPSGFRRRSKRSADETTWVPRSWCGYMEMTGLSVAMYDATLTLCSPNAVLPARRLLRLRGFQVDRADLCLTPGFDTRCPTVAEFWTSPLGHYLRNFAGANPQKLPVEAFRLLVQWDLLTKERYGRMLDIQGAKESKLSSREITKPVQEFSEQIELVAFHATISALKKMLDLAESPHHRHEKLYDDDKPNPHLLKNIDSFTMLAFQHIFHALNSSLVIMTGGQRLALVPECDFEKGDEVWVVMGCEVPVVLRPLPNGRYWHVCAANIPAIQEHELLQNLSSFIAPGDRVGEWMVKDIEVE